MGAIRLAMFDRLFKRDHIKTLRNLDKDIDHEIDLLEEMSNDHKHLLELLKNLHKMSAAEGMDALREKMSKIEGLLKSEIAEDKKSEKMMLRAVHTVEHALKQESEETKKAEGELQRFIEDLKDIESHLIELVRVFRKYEDDPEKIKNNLAKIIEAVVQLSAAIFTADQEITALRQELVSAIAENLLTIKILIVEDIPNCLEALEMEVKHFTPRFFPSFSKEDLDIAKWYERAEHLIKTKHYDIILLDHNLPRTEHDLHDYMDEDIGYFLIEKIKKKSKSTIIVGTSSKADEVNIKPDYHLEKSNVYDEGGPLLKKVLSRKKKEMLDTLAQ
jgi:CheY-like chemotaxis protein